MAETDLASLLERMGEARVVCVGDVMLDRFVEGAVERISPEAPIPVLSVKRERTAPGGAANVARNIAALGAECRLVSAVGADAAAEELHALLGAQAGIRPLLTAVPGRPTAVKTRYIAGRAQLLRADREDLSALPEEAGAALRDAALAQLKGAEAETPGALILSDYGKGVLTPGLIADLIAAARAAGVPVIVDPKGRDYRRYAGADFVTPNRAELALASGETGADDAAVTRACRTLAAECDLGGVLATRSEAGMTLYRRDGDRAEHLKARAREVFDVAGAGDTVVAALAVGLALGLEAREAAALANRAAGIVVAKAGTAVAYPGDLLNDSYEERLAGAEAKLLTQHEAEDRVAAWRRAGKRVGFTNGCFDLLHPGHVSLIAQARAACDRLVVGLNSDASVARLKGPGRPVQDEASRAAVLGALADVDAVVIFGEDTPLALIEALLPDVLVKGADYTKDRVVGAEAVEAAGGRVLLADLVDGQSTTATLARLSDDGTR
jgi:D-beta-D-heptose 7-phosphate kinase/D-beta-D-heptose 1-phosphate adenosyltransferase